jgi:vacuolar-type H+-ATPase subunit F/Vma7
MSGFRGDMATGRMAVIGERTIVQGYALAGATVCVAEDAAAVRLAWQALADEVCVVVLTAAAAEALGAAGSERLAVVLP